MDSPTNTEMAQSRTTAPTVTVENGSVRISGGFGWTPGDGQIDPVRSSADYVLEVPIAGTPFDPSFRPPPVFAQEGPTPIHTGVDVQVGDPQTQNVMQTGDVSVTVYNFGTQAPAIFAPDGSLIQPQPQLSQHFIGLEGLRWVTDGPNGTSNISTVNFFLNFNEDYSRLLSISATQVIESSIFVPIPGDDPTVVASGNLVALGLNDFVPIQVEDIMEDLLPSTPDPGPVATQGDDVLMGTSDADQINALGGNDTVTGDEGADTLNGGTGDDRLIGNQQADILRGGAGFDTLLGGDGDDTLIGGDGADSLYGNNDNDLIEGGQGFDQLFGGAGNDTLLSGETADRVFGGDGDDVIRGGTNLGLTVDGLFGENGNDTIFGEGGFDMLDGGGGDDRLDGGGQADNLFGRGGEDILIGGQGSDRLFGGAENDTLIGGQGTDGLFGQQGNDDLDGGTQSDRLFGGSGNDTLEGGADNDVLFGGAGFDTIYGGLGDDTLEGNFNADVFVFTDGHGNDTVTDFAATNNFERIDFSGLSAINSLADLNLGSASSGAATQVGSDVLIDTGGGNSITLTGVTLSTLDGFDFTF